MTESKTRLKNIFQFQAASLSSPIVATALNILLLYIAYTLNRIEYLLENYSYFVSNIQDGSIWKLLWGGVVFDTPGIFYTNALYILLMLLPFHIKERAGWYKMCKWVFIIINSFFLIINVADSIYFNYTLKRTSWSIFSEFGSESFFKIILIETIKHWYLIIYLILLIYGLWKLYFNPQIKKSEINKYAYYPIMIISLIIAAVTTIGGIRGGYLNHWEFYIIAIIFIYLGWQTIKNSWNRGIKITGILLITAGAILICCAPIGGFRHRDIRPIALSNANAYANRPIETSLILNTSFSMIRSIGDVAFKDPHYYDDKKELDKLYNPVYPGVPSNKMQKKNIVVIIIESFGREYIGGMNKELLGADYTGYTPFTDSLLKESAWWKYSYDNGGKSIDAMPSILASIPKFVRPFISTPQSMNQLCGFPGLLRKEGYSTAFFHGARTGSMGFDGFARSIGFQKYHGREDYNKDKRFNGDEDFDGYWAIWDEEFLQYYALQMSEMKEPFMTALFTASNHHPFKVPEKYANKFPEGTLKIHPTVGYTDYSLKKFFETARKQKWYDNTIFVITNDHTNMRDNDLYRSDIATFYGPVIIFDPSGQIAPGERDGITQQIDIMPTILNYLGYPHPYIAFGTDIFSTPKEDSWGINYINGIYQYVKYGMILQFDGEKSIAMYNIDDHLMNNNVIKENEELMHRMEKEVKAIIQSYMDRMINDELYVN